LLTGARYGTAWHYQGVQADFYDLKGVLESLFAALRISPVIFPAESSRPYLHPGRSCRIVLGEKTAGFVGEIHPEVRQRLDLRNRALVFQLDMEMLASHASPRPTFHDISKYPASSRDVAFMVPVSLAGETLCRLAYDQHEVLLENVSIFDVYTGKNMPAGMKSLGLRFAYRSGERTLRDEEVNSAHSRIVQAMVEKTGARVRGE